MMEKPSEINLIEPGSFASAFPVEAQLQRVSVITLTILIVIGLVLGIGVLYLRVQGKLLTQAHQVLSDSINNQGEKESLFLGVRDRLRVAQLTVDAGVKWSRMLGIINSIVQPPTLSSISVESTGYVVLTMELSRMEDAFVILSNIVSEITNKTIRNPQIMSFQLSKTGGVQFVLGFQSAL